MRVPLSLAPQETFLVLLHLQPLPLPPPFLAALKHVLSPLNTHTHTHTLHQAPLHYFSSLLQLNTCATHWLNLLPSSPSSALHAWLPTCHGPAMALDKVTKVGPTCSLVRITFPSSSDPDHALPPEIPSTYIFLVSWLVSSLSGCSLEPSRTDSPFTAHPFTGGCRPHGSLCPGPWLIPPVYSSWKGSGPSARSEHPACSPAPCCLPDVPLDCLAETF